MEDKSKVIVFEMKEMALLLLLLVVVASISFMMGVHIGKDMAYEKAGYAPEDKEAINLMSSQEESVKEIESKDEAKKISDEEIRTKLREELENLQKNVDDNPTEKVEQRIDSSSITPAETTPAKTEFVEEKKSEQSSMLGKYTIQIGSYPSLKEAKDYAEGFTIRGYNPIINEVHIDGKGTWYRVSLETFDSIPDAKSYISKEESLFQGIEYLIVELK